MNKRLLNLLIAAALITLGILTSLFSSIPGSVGDILYAAIVFFVLRTILMSSNRWVLAIVSLLFCYAIEFSNLVDIGWLNDFKANTMGKLSLGGGFLWSDLWTYAVGIILSWYIDTKVNP